MSQLRIHKLLNYRMIRRQLCKVQSHLLEMFVKRSREPIFFLVKLFLRLANGETSSEQFKEET